MKSLLYSFLLLISLGTMIQKSNNQDSNQPAGKTNKADDVVFITGKVGIDQATPETTLRAGGSKEIVRAFLEEVRSGKAPEKASLYMAETVLAHQMNAENETTVKRTPQNYADHVREFSTLYGNYAFQVTELLAEGDKVYARWKQTGKHLTTLEGYAATGQSLVEIASAVYRIEDGKIAEYWIQIDRLGLEEQLKRDTTK